jgi:hypothetical protein
MGCDLVETLLECLQRYGLKMENIRGQGYNGALVMCGKLKGVQICNNTLAAFVHRAARSLNLAITEACSSAPIINCMAIANKFSANCFFPDYYNNHK